MTYVFVHEESSWRVSFWWRSSVAFAHHNELPVCSFHRENLTASKWDMELSVISFYANALDRHYSGRLSWTILFASLTPTRTHWYEQLFPNTPASLRLMWNVKLPACSPVGFSCVSSLFTWSSDDPVVKKNLFVCVRVINRSQELLISCPLLTFYPHWLLPSSSFQYRKKNRCKQLTHPFLLQQLMSIQRRSNLQ